MNAAASPLIADLLRVRAAWAQHGPATLRALAEKSGLSPLTVNPRAADLLALGVLAPLGLSASEPVYHLAVAGPTTLADLTRQINTLPVADQVAIAAATLARAGHRKTHRRGAIQPELSLTSA